MKTFFGFAVGSVLALGAAARANVIVNDDVTAPGDPIVGVAATAGTATSTLATATGTGGANSYPASESPANAIDNSLTDKYLNFGKTGVGFITTTTANGPSTVVNGIRFSTGNDAQERDPITVTLEGSNATDATTSLNSAWTLLYSGDTGLTGVTGRNTAGPLVPFVNFLSFSSYRVLVTSVRTPTSANSMQVGEVDLIGSTVVPEPASLGTIGMAGLLGFGRGRRRGGPVA